MNAISVAETALREKHLLNAHDAALADAMDAFIAKVKPHADAIDFSNSAIANDELVESNSHWAALRQLADGTAQRVRRATPYSS